MSDKIGSVNALFLQRFNCILWCMIDTKYLRNNLLIATPSVTDAVFQHAVIYLYEHNDEGSIGVIINKPLHVSLFDVLQHTGSAKEIVAENLKQEPVLLGGPTQQDSGLIVYSDLGSDVINIASSLEMLDSIAQGTGPARRLMVLGYCGWDAGQLEEEVFRNDWLLLPSNIAAVFEVPLSDRWFHCYQALGIKDIYNFTGGAGNA
jgi:putative transcriptional regulator